MNIMLDIQQKRKLRSFMYNKFTLLTLFILVIVSVHSAWVVYDKKMESESLMNRSKQRVDELRKREEDLNQKIERLDTEVGIEEEIRSKFSVTKENENMVIVVPKEEKIATSAPMKITIWAKLMSYFK